MKQQVRLALCAFSIAGCTANSAVPTTQSKPELPVITVVQKDTILETRYVADIEAVQNVEIRAKVSGFLDKILIDEGREVKKGQILFKLNDEEYKADLASAKALLSNAMAEEKGAELEVKRVKLLVDKKVISKTELELAEARLTAAHAKVNEARSNESNAALKLSYTNIRAPFDGIINRIPLKAGSLVNEGALLTTVSDVRAIYAYFNVSENEYLRYRNKEDKENDQVELILSNGETYTHKGKIETIEGEFDETTGSIAFRARFPNPGKLLRHGASGKVRLTNKIEDALMVPQKSTFDIQDKNFVFVLNKENKVKMRHFKPKTRVADYYIVQEGLEKGDRIVYEGMQDLRDGAIITPKESSAVL